MIHRGRVILLAAAALGVVSLFLPFYTAESLGDISAVAADGTRPALALIGAGLVAIVGDRGDSLGGISAVAAAAAVTLAIILSGALLIDATLARQDAASIGATATIASGLWIMTAASVVGLVGVVVAMGRRLS